MGKAKHRRNCGPAANAERLAEHLLNDLGPQIASFLSRRFGWALSPDGIDTAIDDAALRLLSREGIDGLPAEKVERLFAAYCHVVARKLVAEASLRGQSGEKCLASETVEKLAAKRMVDSTPAPQRASTPEEVRVHKVIDSLRPRDREILWIMACEPPDGRDASALVAEELKIPKDAARKACKRALQRFKEAFLKLLRLEKARGSGRNEAPDPPVER